MRQKKVKQLRKQLRRMGYKDGSQHNVEEHKKPILIQTPSGYKVIQSITNVWTLKDDCLKFAMKRAKYRYNQLTFKRGKGVPK